MSNFLNKIKETVINRINDLPELPHLRHNDLDFCKIFANPLKPAIIAEIKFASPSRGRIYHGKLSHVEIASSYLRNGAAGLSVLAEPHYFEGNIQYIQDIRNTAPKAHILLKDFILSKKQIAQGLMKGANAVLLIVAFLDKENLKTLHQYAIDLGLAPVVEVHDMQELETALSLDPKAIGVNNRNLKTLDINLDTSRLLIQHIPNNVYRICESGIENLSQIKEMHTIGFNGFLIGSSLMKHNDPGRALKAILSGGHNEG